MDDGEIETAIEIEVHNASASAEKKVEDAGGTITFVKNN
ncbi:MAG: uL15m family ribosomal protein [Fodinibius sp.]|nr:uL15m family ribosomal protein [Fodinibius sp.]